MRTAPQSVVADSPAGAKRKGEEAEHLVDSDEEGVDAVLEAAELELTPRVAGAPRPAFLPGLAELIGPYAAALYLLLVPTVEVYLGTSILVRLPTAERCFWFLLLLAGVVGCFYWFGRRRRPLAAACLAIGTSVAFYLLYSAIVSEPAVPYGAPPTDRSQSEMAKEKVAIVGGGPSGMGALWFLHRLDGRREITLFEGLSDVGGHSHTVPVDGKEIDVGFIFSVPNYNVYEALISQYNYTRQHAAISVAYHGERRPDGSGAGFLPWSNLANGSDPRDAHVKSDIAKWKDLASDQCYAGLKVNPGCSATATILRAFTPLGVWLWWNGFSAGFTERVLRPVLTPLFERAPHACMHTCIRLTHACAWHVYAQVLTPLFVTNRGCMMQSAAATISYFSSYGFLSLGLSECAAPSGHHPPITPCPFPSSLGLTPFLPSLATGGRRPSFTPSAACSACTSACTRSSCTSSTTPAAAATRTSRRRTPSTGAWPITLMERSAC